MSASDDLSDNEQSNETGLKNLLSSQLHNAFASNLGHESVRVALIYWEDDDLKVRDEVEEFEDFLCKTFNYKSTLLPIPSERAQMTLTTNLSNFVYQYGASRQSLLVIFYAGHGDPNSNEKKAVWAAKNQQGPTLNWYEVQPILLNAAGDVLLILDCCYALQAARAHENRTVELLAASGVHGRTPPPGDYSFTKILIRVMGRMLGDLHQVNVYDLWRRLVTKTATDEEVFADPHHFYLAEGEGSITLRPVQASQPLRDRPRTAPPALLSLTISLSQRPDGLAMRRLGNWLKNTAPRSVSDIAVDEMLLQAERIQTFLQHSQYNRLQSMISHDLQERQQPETITVAAQAQSLSTMALENEARELIERLLSWNDRVCQSIQSNLLLCPSFSSAATLERLLTDNDARFLNLSEGARLRLLEIGSNMEKTITDFRPLPSGSVNVFSQGKGAEHQPGVLWYGAYGRAVVVIEYRSAPPVASYTRREVQHLSALLSQAKDPYFHLAPFVGYLDEPHNNVVGLVFRVPIIQGSDEYESLSMDKALTNYSHTTLHEELSRIKCLSLNRRLDMAIALARAIFAFHAVGWLHKSFNSKEVVFFCQVDHPSVPANKAPQTTVTTQFEESAEDVIEPEGKGQGMPRSSKFDPAKPYIFGFDHTRNDKMSSACTREFHPDRLIYTHPERWGRPSKYFCMEHDVYGLGVILLEIGCWQQAHKMDRSEQGFRNVRHETDVRDALLVVAKEQLPHMAGEAYSRAVVACLDKSLVGEADRDRKKKEDYIEEILPMQNLRLHKAFGKFVLDVLVAARRGL